MKPFTLLLLSIVFIAAACTPIQAIENEVIEPTPKLTLEPLTPTPIPLTSPTATTGPSGERIGFRPDTNIVTRDGVLAESEDKEYVISASATQSLYVQTLGYKGPVSFTILGPNGASWAGEPHPSETSIFTTQVVLPQNGDYLVVLATTSDAGATRYEVVFTNLSSPLPTVEQPKESPERVEFASESLSSERISLLPSGFAVKQYVITGKADQRMTVGLTSDDVPIRFSITRPSGIQLILEPLAVDSGFRARYTFTLVETGDYIVTLTKAEQTPSTNYTVSFTNE